MAKLLYQGHGSFRIVTQSSVVIYVDPYAGKGYDLPADIILVTHQHGDHNQIKLVTRKTTCTVIQNQDSLQKGSYQSFTVQGVHIQAFPAYNKNHSREQCVGYIIALDGLKIYASGDVSIMKEMKDLADLKLDYSLMPIDGVYNMDPKEASVCAELIGAKHAIPIHMKPGALFDAAMVEKFTAKNRLIVRDGEEIEM